MFKAPLQRSGAVYKPVKEKKLRNVVAVACTARGNGLGLGDGQQEQVLQVAKKRIYREKRSQPPRQAPELVNNRSVYLQTGYECIVEKSAPQLRQRTL